MKCLQCGTELDRLSKWRSSSEYCSEECKKESQEEFNRLAMNRLMQPRAARSAAKANASAVRTVESGSGRLTVVTHPVGASSPIVTEPPEAGFIMDGSAILVELQLRHHPHLPTAPVPPIIPDSDLRMGSALAALETILAGIRPQPRGLRKYSPVSRTGVLTPPVAALAVPVPDCDLAWPASLGLQFSVAGIDTPSTVRTVPSSPGTAPPSMFPGRPELGAGHPVAHRAIPSRRPARSILTPNSFERGAERLVPAPVVSAPRLRIHLPRPALSPFRPRYAFAPAPGSTVAETAAASAVVTPAPAPASSAVEREDRKKKGAAKSGKPVPSAAKESAPATPSPEAKAKSQDSAPASRPSSPVVDPKAETAMESLPAATLERSKQPESVKPGKAAKPVSEKPSPQNVPLPRAAAEQKPAPVDQAKSSQTPNPTSNQTFDAPSFGGKSEEAEPEGFFARMPGWQKALAALVVIGIAVGAWAVPALSGSKARANTSMPTSAAPASAVMGPESWETDSTGDTAGVARRRVISRYKPARGKRDYSFEFSGQIQQRAMGWVFRVKDARNYYCLKLERIGDGVGAKFQLVKFAVVNGEEQPHRLVELREPLTPGAPVKVRLDVRGQQFSTQINGRPVDVWIDNQIADGTVGLSNENGERALVDAVKVTY
jgi:hypothetical protein